MALAQDADPFWHNLLLEAGSARNLSACPEHPNNGFG